MMCAHPMRTSPRVAVIALAVVAACGRTTEPERRAPPDAEADAAIAPPPSADERNREVVALADAVLAECDCEHDGCRRFHCPAMAAWHRFDFERSHTATLVSLLADDAPMRWRLAVQVLVGGRAWIADDATLQAVVLDRAEALPKDISDDIATRLGNVIGFLTIGTSERFDRIAAIVRDPDAPPVLRAGIVNWLLAGNQASEPVYQLTVEQARHGATPLIRASALVALSAAYNHRATDEMCALWIAALPTLDDKTGALIASHLTNGDLQVSNQEQYTPYGWQMVSSAEYKCPAATVDAALTLIARRVAAHTALDYGWVSALRGPAQSTNATPAQRRKAAAIAKRYLADRGYHGYVRGAALKLLVLLDPPAARVLAARYAGTDDALGDAAEAARKALAKARR